MQVAAAEADEVLLEEQPAEYEYKRPRSPKKQVTERGVTNLRARMMGRGF